MISISVIKQHKGAASAVCWTQRASTCCRYLHGAPVVEGELLLRYGYVSGKNAPVIIPSSVVREKVRHMNT